MSNLKDAQRYELDKVLKQHDLSLQGDSKVIDALNMDGRNTLRDTDYESNDQIKSLSGEILDKNNFLVNDQGIKTEPFFKGSGLLKTEGFRNLEIHQGGSHAFRPPKTEIGPMFAREKNLGLPFGARFEGANADQSRYVEGNYRTNELPFEQERVSHIDIKDSVNRDVDLLYAQRNSTDNIRTLNNQKLSFGGKVTCW